MIAQHLCTQSNPTYPMLMWFKIKCNINSIWDLVFTPEWSLAFSNKIGCFFYKKFIKLYHVHHIDLSGIGEIYLTICNDVATSKWSQSVRTHSPFSNLLHSWFLYLLHQLVPQLNLHMLPHMIQTPLIDAINCGNFQPHLILRLEAWIITTSHNVRTCLPRGWSCPRPI